ncbi:unnamed protein product [Rotaria sp. Silwood2]|nr:unnamed protein product [Rotaria sp. Silwood2]
MQIQRRTSFAGAIQLGYQIRDNMMYKFSFHTKNQLLLSGYRYHRTNKSQNIWRCCRNDFAGPVQTISVELKSNLNSDTKASQDPPRCIHPALLKINKKDSSAISNYPPSQRTIEQKREKQYLPSLRPKSFSDILIPNELNVTNGGGRFLLHDNDDVGHGKIVLSSDDDLDCLLNSENWHCAETFKARYDLAIKSIPINVVFFFY